MPYTKPKRSRLMTRIMYKMRTVNVRKPTLPIATMFPHHYTGKHLDLPIRRAPVKRESDEGSGCMAKGLKAEPIEFPQDLEQSFHAGQLQQHCSLAAKHCQDDDVPSQKARWGYCNKPTMTRCSSVKQCQGTTSGPWPQRLRQTPQINSSLLTSPGKGNVINSSEVADNSFNLSADNGIGPQHPGSTEVGLKKTGDKREHKQNWENKDDDTFSPQSTDITCKEGISENLLDKVVHTDMNLRDGESAVLEDTALAEIPSEEHLFRTEHDVKNNNVEEIIHSSLPWEEDNPPSPVFSSEAVLGALSIQGSIDEKHKKKKSWEANGTEVVTEYCGFKISSCGEGLVPEAVESKTETFWKEVVNDNSSDVLEPPFPLTQKYQAETDDIDDCAVPDEDNLDPLIFPDSPLLYSQHSEM
ncbi:uncharacterized protein LOC118414319 isoform X1 [Branchiostoma floridae]|uniref:Uncharacterized protein LOC118414319 isoform X1 n=1 Tax=Branchiostoma floridae TaxID=7739 RepID=A0A9J7L1G4_BRAFL|nr:uncharacterized protein LOC118414319 isoform X1 [Branchiostoma floridae]